MCMRLFTSSWGRFTAVIPFILRLHAAGSVSVLLRLLDFVLNVAVAVLTVLIVSLAPSGIRFPALISSEIQAPVPFRRFSGLRTCWPTINVC